jgi:nucleoside-diphosphate-sugar epimerase
VEFAKRMRVKKIINLSTVNVYGNITKNNLTEKEIPNNPDILGITKLIGERIIEESQSKFINLRLPGILCLKNAMDRPWISKVLNDLKKHKEIKIYNRNSNFNNVIDTMEIAIVLEKIFLKKGAFNKTFNLSASKPIKIHKLISFLKLKSESKSKVSFITKKNQSFIISNKKINKELNFIVSSTLSIIKRNLF